MARDQSQPAMHDQASKASPPPPPTPAQPSASAGSPSPANASQTAVEPGVTAPSSPSSTPTASGPDPSAVPDKPEMSRVRSCARSQVTPPGSPPAAPTEQIQPGDTDVEASAPGSRQYQWHQTGRKGLPPAQDLPLMLCDAPSATESPRAEGSQSPASAEDKGNNKPLEATDEKSTEVTERRLSQRSLTRRLAALLR